MICSDAVNTIKKTCQFDIDVDELTFFYNRAADLVKFCLFMEVIGHFYHFVRKV